ncbi:hypothetical protein KSX_12800 [Ktedonospora formicarum]|uniref:Glycosyltransferase RgtA/B/C/D-like domain-containing protein n=2 Tax=Ktedonospora formicarum TaxID=2778364 RepID=A0A8J3HYS2_9CHLR|nr:hypothetical protein KSX_12800 [Ktedonospora formicarum]
MQEEERNEDQRDETIVEPSPKELTPEEAVAFVPEVENAQDLPDVAPFLVPEPEESESTSESTPVIEEAVADQQIEQPFYEYEEAVPVPEQISQGFRFMRPSREQILRWAPFLGLMLLGAILRYWGLGDKPLHHDESLHAYYSLMLMHNLENWLGCFSPTSSCYRYDPLLHGPFQFHAIALVYQICQWLGLPEHGVNTTTVRIAAATLGTVIVGLPYFIRDYLGKYGALVASFLLAVSPSMVYFSRFAREDIYMACFTLLVVVAMARYCRDRSLSWLIIGSIAFALSYATKEATFLTIAIFGSFFVGLIVWDIGARFTLVRNTRDTNAGPIHALTQTWAPWAVLMLAVVAAPLALLFFRYMHNLSLYINDVKTKPLADTFVAQLKNVTVAIVPWLGIALGVYVLVILMMEYFEKLPVNDSRRRGLAKFVDPVRQPLLDVVTTMPWIHWVFAILCGWAVFLVLFTVIFTNIRGGIGDGIWQGLYYWLQQQQVARGDQPWYYYFLLIPLYEQVGLVFGIVGVIRCLIQPSRFRLFLVYWFLGSVVIYTWAGEKMPWLMIHMTMPMMLLAAIGLQPALVKVVAFVRERIVAAREKRAHEEGQLPVAEPHFHIQPVSAAGAIATLVVAVLLLLPTLQNMFQVSYVHAADGPHEMMVYVQTTPDVNKVMDQVAAVDKKAYGGQQNMPVSVMGDATWPFAWYLRDYHQTTFINTTEQDPCPAISGNPPVIIVGGDCLASYKASYQETYKVTTYHMRTWWDEGYKLPPCVPSKNDTCEGKPTWGGVGPLLWLSYGDTPPKNAQFDLGRASSNVWNWWWHRQAIGSTTGSYDMAILVRNDLAR